MTDPFRLVVADPPWPFGDKLPGAGRGAAKHYALVGMPEIRAYLPELLAARGWRLADDALLVLWRVAAMAEDAYAVARAWGFPSCQREYVWVKTTRADPGRVRVGMGRVLRNAHEAALVANRGTFRPADRGVPSVLLAERGAHSAKPAGAFAHFERLAGPGSKLELFARHPRPGWTCVGDELPGGLSAPGVRIRALRAE